MGRHGLPNRAVRLAASCNCGDDAILINHANTVISVVGEVDPDLRLAGEDAEVVHPEPGQLLPELRRRGDRPNQMTPTGLIDHVVADLIERRPGGLLVVV